MGDLETRGSQSCRIVMLFVSIVLLVAESFGTGVPFVSVAENLGQWISILLIGGLVIVSSRIARSFPSTPLILWIAFEATEVTWHAQLQGMRRGLSTVEREAFLPVIYLVFASANLLLLLRQRKSEA